MTSAGRWRGRPSRTGFTAAGLAAHRALTAAGPRTPRSSCAMVFAGTRHDDDEYAGVLLGGSRGRIPNAVIIGCSATGVLTGAEEVENATAVAVLVLGGQAAADAHLPSRACAAIRARRARASGVRRCAALGGERGRRGGRGAGRSGGARRGRLRGRHRRRGARAAHHRRGRVGRRDGLPRVLEGRGPGRRLRGAGLPARAAPEPGDDPGVPGGRRSADHHRGRGEPDPGDRGAAGGRGAGEDAVEPEQPGAAAR